MTHLWYSAVALTRPFILWLVLVQTMKCPDMSEKSVDWEVQHYKTEINLVIVVCSSLSMILGSRYCKYYRPDETAPLGAI